MKVHAVQQVKTIILIGFALFALGFREGEPLGFSKRLTEAAIERTKHKVTYDGSYRKIPYPDGDVPDNIGVCTDVVIRSYRKLGIDLQKDLHEDMTAVFDEYPKKWGHKKPDTNIDHRRVPNLKKLFKRKGIVLKKSRNAEDYLPGDLVTWLIPQPSSWFRKREGLPHIGIVVNKKSPDGKRYMIVHNIGRGTQLEDALFEYEITGHYRYYGMEI